MHSVKVGTQSVSKSHDPPAPAKKDKSGIIKRSVSFYTESNSASNKELIDHF